MQGFLLLAGLVLSTSAVGAEKPWIGEQKAVVLNLEWSNKPAEISIQQIEDDFFGDDKSLKQFFRENSVGKFDLSGKVYEWRQTDKDFSDSFGCDLDLILKEAWSLFGEDVNIADFDADGNGKIDHLFVIHSGRIGSDRVGPECTFTTFEKADFSAVFQSQGVGSQGVKLAIGFYIHEGGHGYYSFPDLYGDHYNGKYGIGMWGMMGLGAWGVANDMAAEDLFRYPAHFEPLSKIEIGWLEPKIADKVVQTVRLKPVEKSGDVFVIPLGNGENYYFEYRSQHGFSADHKGHGLLIWKNYKIVQADGRDDLNNGTPQGRRPLPPIAENFGDDSDPFPGSDGITQYVDQKNGISITDIVQTEDYVEFKFSAASHFAWPQYAKPIVPTFDGYERL